jgi:hypothetical protein
MTVKGILFPNKILNNGCFLRQSGQGSGFEEKSHDGSSVKTAPGFYQRPFNPVKMARNWARFFEYPNDILRNIGLNLPRALLILPESDDVSLQRGHFRSPAPRLNPSG